MKDTHHIASDRLPCIISKFQLNEKAGRWLTPSNLVEFTQHWGAWQKKGIGDKTVHGWKEWKLTQLHLHGKQNNSSQLYIAGHWDKWDQNLNFFQFQL